LTPDAAGGDPLVLFRAWQSEAAPSEAEQATAMVLATADPEGGPSARVVLLKGCDERGFVFFTNYHSRKGRELDLDPRAALCFYWPSLARQARIEGTVERLSAAESDSYFAARSRGSQIGAWASRQSATLDSRADLEAHCAEHAARFAGREVPRPPFWGGYRVRPRRIEFWSGRDDRLHERLVYERGAEQAAWTARLLYP
jgi:pyridoxamine 5'-phosphate oxidase